MTKKATKNYIDSDFLEKVLLLSIIKNSIKFSLAWYGYAAIYRQKYAMGLYE